jgi:hypothetical protein
MDRTPVTNAEFARFMEAREYERREYRSEAGWRAKQKERWSKPRYWDNSDFNHRGLPLRRLVAPGGVIIVIYHLILRLRRVGGWRVGEGQIAGR